MRMRHTVVASASSDATSPATARRRGERGVAHAVAAGVTWRCVDDAVRCVLAGCAPSHSFQSIHHTVFQLTMRGNADAVLQRIDDAMRVHARAIAHALLRDGDAVQAAGDDAFVTRLVHCVQRYCASLHTLSDVFFYLDKQYAQRVLRQSLYDLGESIAYDELLMNDAVVARLHDEVARAATACAETAMTTTTSSAAHESTLRACARLLCDVCGGRAFAVCVERPYVRALLTYYDACAEARRRDSTVTQYLAWVTTVLATEQRRARRLFACAPKATPQPSTTTATTTASATATAEKIEASLFDRLVSACREFVLFSATGYATLLRHGDVSLLQPLVPLLSRASTGEDLACVTAAYVKERMNSTCHGAAVDGHTSARGAASTNAVAVVEQTLAVVAHARQLVTLLGATHAAPRGAMVEQALYDGINACGHFADYLAQYVDHNMRCYVGNEHHNVGQRTRVVVDNDDDDDNDNNSYQGNERSDGGGGAGNIGSSDGDATRDDAHGTLRALCERTFTLLRMLRDKDAFEVVMRNLLASRLMVATPRCLLAERFVVQELRHECGASTVSRLERMLADLQCATEAHVRLLSDTADAVVRDADGAATANLDFHAVVLTGGFWPHFPSLTLHVTPSMQACMHHFSRLYLSHHNGRRLTFQLSLGTVVFTLRHRARVYEVCAPTPFVHALLALDTDSRVSVPALCAASALSRHDVELQMTALCRAGLATRAGAHAFAFNVDFVSDRATVRVYAHAHRLLDGTGGAATPSSSLPAYTTTTTPMTTTTTTTTAAATHCAVDGSHARSLDAAIVQSLKVHKTLDLETLYRVVAERATRGTPTLTSLKDRLDVLIDKGFVSRAGGSEDKSYQYCD